MSNITASVSYLTGLVVKYRRLGVIKQLLVYASNATSTGYVTLSSTQLATIISNVYSNMGLPADVAIGYSAGYTTGYLQNSNIVLNITTSAHYQSTLLTF